MEKTLLELLKEKGIPTTDPTNTMIADAATSVAPAILSLLGGSDTTSVNRQFAKGNQYLSTRGDQDAEAIKNMKQIDVNGMPVNVKPIDALYQQVIGNDGRPIKGLYQERQAYDKQTGEYGTRIFNTATGKSEFIPDVISGATAPKVTTLPTIQGGKEVSPINPYLKSKPPIVKHVPGIGDVAQGTVPSGTVSKQEAEQFIKDSAKAKDKKVKIVDAKANAEQSVRILSNPSATPEELAAGVQLMLKAVNKERLSDPDAVRLMGSEYKSIMRIIEDVAAGRGLGEINPKTRQGFINVARSFISSSDKEMKKIDDLYTPSGRLPSKGQNRLNQTSKGSVDKKDDWKKRKEALKGIK